VAATKAAAAIFGGGELSDLPAAVLKAVNAELGGVGLTIGTDFPTVVEVMVAAGVVPSKSAGRRTVAEGGAYLNNVKVADPEQLTTAEDLLAQKFLVVRRGRKTVGAVEITRLA
jgi:tyrosyl-tRNA synthetase